MSNPYDQGKEYAEMVLSISVRTCKYCVRPVAHYAYMIMGPHESVSINMCEECKDKFEAGVNEMLAKEGTQ